MSGAGLGKQIRRSHLLPRVCAGGFTPVWSGFYF